jgi:hypothetical protein
MALKETNSFQVLHTMSNSVDMRYENEPVFNDLRKPFNEEDK